ncbi:reverse transcriptase domain-containing protein [Tanacetum coccineum]
MNILITFPSIPSEDISDEPLIAESGVEGYLVRRVCVDAGSLIEVMFEHCFKNLNPRIKAKLRETQTDLVGFAGEISKLLGKIELEVCFGNNNLCRRTSMKFIMVRAPLPYNIILGRPGLKTMRAIPSTIHSMMKFPTPKGIATLVTQTVIIAECRRLEKKQMIKGESSEEGKKEDNMGVFAWEPSDMTGVPRKIIEHALNVNLSLDPGLSSNSNGQRRRRKGSVLYRSGDILLHQIALRAEKRRGYIPKAGRLNVPVPNRMQPGGVCGRQSKDEKMLLADIAETFNNLKKINMKLNPKKCSFGVEEGKFIGNAERSLSGKLAALNRFLAKSDERSLPFFNTLKNITKENKHEYQWTNEAEGAFQQINKLVLDLPSLTPPFPKETLYAYLAVAKEAVSAVLLADRKGRQCPVQYVSRTLNEAERNYAPMKKLALSLIHMTRRLRRYFEAHPVKVIMDQQIKHILSKTETSRKLAKYCVELGAYNITFIPRNAVEGQVLAYFLSEAPEGEKEKSYFWLPGVPLEKDDTECWTLFTDGAFNPKGSGARLVLIGPSGIEYTYALHLTFLSTNNETEYEALLVGLRITWKMSISKIEVKVDSKLVENQINGSYEASKYNMIKYLAKAKEYISNFKSFSIKNIPRNMNQKADVLIEEEGDNWMTPIIRCLEEGIWPGGRNEVRCLQAKIGQYTMESGVLFKKGYLVPILRCVGPLQANYVIREIHIGSCGMHVGPRAMVRKVVRQGYYWPTMHKDAKEEVQKCDSCQIHAPVPTLPKTLMTSIMAPLPLYQWGMDILGALPPVRGGAKFLIMAIDYFTKWIEANPLVRIIGKEINTAVAHPQANGLVERANRSLMEGIKTRLRREKAGWVDELPNFLWAHQTSIKQSSGETLFSLTYDSEAVILDEIGIPTYRTLMIREGYNEEEIRLNLDLLQERREAAAIREARYKTKMEQYYHKKVHPACFRPGEFIFQRNEASRVEDQGKIGPKWEGSYRVVEAYENGCYKL